MSENINPIEQLEPVENPCPACETPAAEPAPVAAEPAPVFAEPAPIAEPAPAPAYVAPAPAPTYAAPAPAPTYAAPAPAPTYAAPAPAPTYAAPAPAPTYTAPTPTYTAPAPTPTYTTPTYSTPTYTAPVPTYSYPAPTAYPVEAKPEVTGKTKALGFIGMGLGIGSLVLAIIGLIYWAIAMDFDGAYAFGMTIGYGMFSMPMSIVGRILSNKSQEAGNTSAACSVGSKMGVAGMVVTIVMLALGFIGLMAG